MRRQYPPFRRYGPFCWRCSGTLPGKAALSWMAGISARVVLPHADVKIFLKADVEVRARRREIELQERGTPRPYKQVLEEMRQRDYNDTHRSAAPLRAAEDAVIVDTSDLDFQQSKEKLLEIIREKVGL